MMFSISDHGTAEGVAKRLESHALRANDMLPVMTRIASNMFEVEESLFHSGGRRGGGSWKQLADSTIKKKGSSEILVQTGELKASLTEPGHRNNILEIGTHDVIFGSSDPFAYIHTVGAGGLPKRPVIKFARFDHARWNRWIAEFLMDGLKI